MATTKPLYSKEEFARRGETFYERDIEPIVKNGQTNDFVAIDIETGHYEIAASESAASDRLLSRIPNAQIWLRRIGSPFIRHFGSSRTSRS